MISNCLLPTISKLCSDMDANGDGLVCLNGLLKFNILFCFTCSITCYSKKTEVNI